MRIEERRRIAGATSPCPAKVPVRQARSGGRGNSRDYHIKDCQVCKGTGRIYALPDVVRVPCPWSKWGSGETTPLNISCHKQGLCPCHGLGWVPSDRLEDWLQAASSYHPVIFPHYKEGWCCDLVQTDVDVQEETTPLGALVKALAQALAADGATLMEVKDE